MGNDVARALNDHRVALADPLALDLVLVVERGAADHDAADGDRAQIGHRGERAGAPDLYGDRLEHGLGLLGGEFMGDRPARRPADIAEPPLPIEPVDLVDHAVDVVVEIGAPGGEALMEGDGRFGAQAQRGHRVDRESPGFEVAQIRPMGLADIAGVFAEPVGVEPQRAAGGDLRVELAERAGGGVARVGKRGLARFFAPAVEREEVVAAHIDLAAHLQDGRRLAAQPVGHIVHRGEVAGHVLAHRAVAARRTEHEPAVLVAERDRQPVDLGLGHDFDGLVLSKAEKAANPRVEIRHLARVEGVAQRQHGCRMGDFRESGRGRGPDPAGRAVVAHQIGKACLERVVAPAQRVVFGVAHLGRVAAMIAFVVMGDFTRQPLEFRRRRVGRQLGRVLRAGHGAVPVIRLSAAARASSVTVMPASMRAISSRRLSRSSSSTIVLISRLDRSPVSRFRTRQCAPPRAATCGEWVTTST